MKILLCSELYFPKMGGVQKVNQEIAENLFLKGHDVSVATSYHPNRLSFIHNGVKIKQFQISGNLVQGIYGEKENYQKFILENDFDALIVNAAQQWTFDLLLPILDKIKYKKIHIPCGYSSFFQKAYKAYYKNMPIYLRKFDHLIYNSTEYRDINLAKENNLKNILILPNGASKKEFWLPPKINIREKLKIPKTDFIFLSVGNPPSNKGHLEVIKAYNNLKLPFPSTLILNGDYSLKLNLKEFVKILLQKSSYNIKRYQKKINSQKFKKVIFTNLNREDLISLFFSANLFVFASKIEYSPLVLFESAAAGLPFLSVRVGNSEEIASWTEGGMICPSTHNKKGYSIVSYKNLGKEMSSLAKNPDLLRLLGENSRKNWMEKFTWEKIVDQIENLIITTSFTETPYDQK
jgi:L-malate glycosyltransferase